MSASLFLYLRFNCDLFKIRLKIEDRFFSWLDPEASWAALELLAKDWLRQVTTFEFVICRHERGGIVQLLGDRVRRDLLRLSVERRLRDARLRAPVRPASRRQRAALNALGADAQTRAVRAWRHNRRLRAAARRARDRLGHRRERAPLVRLLRDPQLPVRSSLIKSL